MSATGKESVVPRGHWRGRAVRNEAQPREAGLALPTVPPDAGPFACHPRVCARAGDENGDQKLEKIRGRKTRRGLATRFFRSPTAPSSPTGREDQVHSDKS